MSPQKMQNRPSAANVISNKSVLPFSKACNAMLLSVCKINYDIIKAMRPLFPPAGSGFHHY
jgi:hypothetical protein